ncbi:beta-glucosidase [Mucilaginibacter terrenus]|uniref:Beta-glucosidase n=1 Tax=Mucilaginibacter terrenus TaxID=2482727 RepID=A0A3E2NYF3_9SPHI|nr:beta-glucosidase [Mucilaginibacter terrenus]
MSDTPNTQLNKQLFGDDFAWGVSTAALQIEGSCDADGKGPSIWDTFSARKGKIMNGDSPSVACDYYQNYKRDIDLVKELNIPNYRFSIAWSRILPKGEGEVNQAGIDHYHKVIDYCLELGIEPWITIYHWDLPQALEDKGGWTNRDIVGWFTRYVEICAQAFGTKVKHWMVMNEPAVFTGAGYFLGIHAPGRMGLRNFLPAVHHVVLSIVAGAKTLRKIVPNAQIGNTFSCSHIEPYKQTPKHIAAAARADALINRLFIEPILGLSYPTEVAAIGKMKKYYKPGDEDNMSFNFDFIGLQNYTREIVKYSFFTPYIGATLVKAENRKVELTDMKWEVYPPAIYEMIKKYNAYSGIKKIIITENGAAFPDVVTNGDTVDDPKRIQYLQTHLQQVLKAKQEGYKVSGYFVWTLTDNFEWAEGYHPRFGLVHVNFKTQQRIIKNSGRWYANFIK